MSARPRQKKRPAHSVIPDRAKRPHVSGQPPDPFQLKPTWRLSAIDMDGPFAWRGISGPDLLRVQDYLTRLERMKWSEILGRSTGNHQPKVNLISAAAQQRLRELDIEVERLVSLRLTSLERIWGIREEAACSMLWWDPKHRVYPTRQRRT